ncbi:MFS transporter [Vibrio alginolyticus]|uniref:MFS transporter n=1 Tax=Vibrio alginolyticus TaxID=663 RepID=UPI001A33A393|nr:MFS transporter [Vibrio alginolyticus]EGQ7844955.1 MFS transporter [Vibrio alginolyticus]EGQ8986440.1 MFS transporter [Vibrio alginolyticus]EGR0306709.1 MFS transporter [Vibrio alginolyticus]EHK5087007.1 MFS transporter [Vibrio alginolyticus]EJN3802838.1 MFS transporter [Vibrio alginolyticus]
MMQSMVLFLVAFLVGVDELMLGSILEPIGNDLSVQPSQVTLFITAYSLAIAICAPYLGRLSDRVGRIRIMVPACFVFGVASITTGIVHDFELAIATRVITGIASAGMLLIAFALAGDAKGNRAMRQIVMVQAGLTLGMITSPAIGALLTQLLSWRAAFIILGVAALLVSAMSVVFMNDQHDESKMSDALPPITGVIHVPGALRAILAMCLGLGGGIGVFNLIGLHIRDTSDLALGWVGAIYAALGIVSVVGNMCVARASRWLGSSRAVMRVALMVCIPCSAWVFSNEMSTVTAYLPALVLWSLAGGVGSPALQAHIASLSDEYRGVLMSFGMSMMHFGVAIWSALAGFAYSVGNEWVAFVAFLLFGSAVVILKPVGNTEQSERYS